MKKLLSLLAAVALSFGIAQAGTYSIDDAAVDNLIDNATEMTVLETVSDASDLNMIGSAAGTLEIGATKEKSALVALLLNSLGYAIGIAGIHRWYLGSGIGTYILYFCTVGGFGCLQAIDWILLLIELIKGDGKIDTYSDNESLFMWKG